MIFCKNQQGQQGKESNILQTSLEDKKSSLVPVISMWAGMPSFGAAIVLELLVHVPAVALFSDVVCLFHLADMHERQFFSEIISFLLTAGIQQPEPPQAHCYGGEVDSRVGHLLLPVVCCNDRLLSVAVQPPQGGAQ